MNENKSIKKKVIIISMILIPVIIILLVIGTRFFITPSDEDIIEKVKNTKYYKGNVEFIIKNNKDVQKENIILYVDKDNGARLEFGTDRVKIYKDGKLKVKDNISKSEYTVNENIDFLHSLCILDKILSYPIESDNINSKQEEWGNGEYIEVFVKVETDIKHVDRARIFIDKKEKKPIGIIIYDRDGNERIRIIYKEFEKLKEFDAELL